MRCRHRDRGRQRAEHVVPRRDALTRARVHREVAAVRGVLDAERERSRLLDGEQLDLARGPVVEHRARAQVVPVRRRVVLPSRAVEPEHRLEIRAVAGNAHREHGRQLPRGGARVRGESRARGRRRARRTPERAKRRDSRERITVPRAEPARREEDAVEQKRVDGPCERARRRLQLHRGQQAGVVQEHAGLREVAAAYEQRGPFIAGLDAGKTLNRAVHLCRGSRRRHDFERRERRATFLAGGVLPCLNRDRRERDSARLQRDDERTRVALGDRSALFGEAQTTDDERQWSGRRGGDVETPVIARDCAFEGFDDEHVRAVDGAGVGTLHYTSHASSRGRRLRADWSRR